MWKGVRKQNVSEINLPKRYTDGGGANRKQQLHDATEEIWVEEVQHSGGKQDHPCFRFGGSKFSGVMAYEKSKRKPVWIDRNNEYSRGGEEGERGRRG